MPRTSILNACIRLRMRIPLQSLQRKFINSNIMPQLKFQKKLMSAIVVVPKDNIFRISVQQNLWQVQYVIKWGHIARICQSQMRTQQVSQNSKHGNSALWNYTQTACRNQTCAPTPAGVSPCLHVQEHRPVVPKQDSVHSAECVHSVQPSLHSASQQCTSGTHSTLYLGSYRNVTSSGMTNNSFDDHCLA